MYNSLKKNSLFFVHLPFVIYLIVLTILLAMPSQDLPETFEVSDKMKHFFAFFVLSFLLGMSLHFQEKFRNIAKYSVFVVLALASFYGGLTEVIQSYVPGRSCDFIDWMFDLGGVLLGILAFLIFIKSINPRFTI